MNKKYITPGVRIIDLSAEGMIAASPQQTMTMSSEEETKDNFDWTQKKNVWGRGGIWK